MTRPDYRPFVPAPGQSNIAGPTPRAHAQARMQNPRAQGIVRHLGETRRGAVHRHHHRRHVQPGLFSLQPHDAPAPAMVAAAKDLLGACRRSSARHVFPVDSALWRRWQNTEIYVEDYGLRLEEVDRTLRAAVLAVLRASLSAKGIELPRDVMRLNRFLGDLVGGPEVLGEWSFIFCLFGEPSLTEPWGWQLFGHHLCPQLPGDRRADGADARASWAPSRPMPIPGPFAGTALFEDEERAGLALMRSLSPEQQRRRSSRIR